MSSKNSPKNTFQPTSQMEKVTPEPRQIRYGTSSLVLDEAELRRAGIRNYHVEVKSCTDGKWEVLYSKSAIVPPARNSQKENKWLNELEKV